MLPRAHWVGAPELTLSPGAGSHRYATGCNSNEFVGTVNRQLFGNAYNDTPICWPITAFTTEQLMP